MAFLKGLGIGFLISGTYNLAFGSQTWAIVAFLGAAVTLGYVRAAHRTSR